MNKNGTQSLNLASSSVQVLLSKSLCHISTYLEEISENNPLHFEQIIGNRKLVHDMFLFFSVNGLYLGFGTLVT